MPIAEQNEDEVRRWVRESCLAQGIPEKVEDPQVLRILAALFAQGRRP